MSTRGIDIRQSSSRILFRVSLKDANGDKVTTGTTELRVYRVEDDGTLDVYDWTTHDFVAPGSGTPDDETTMTHQQRRDSTGADVDTGIWTAVLSTLTNWTSGQVYIAQVTNSNAVPESQEREFQFGGVEGGQLGVTVEGRTLDVTATGAAGIDWGNIENKTTIVNLSQTSVGNVNGNVGGNVIGNVNGSVASVTGNVGGNVVGSVASVTGNVGGNVVGSVASVTAGVTVSTNNDKTGYTIAGTKQTLDALNDGDATAANQATIASYIDTEIGTIITNIAALNDLDAAGVRAALGMSAADLDTQLGNIPTTSELNARTLVAANYATAANQTTMDGKLDTLLGRITANLFSGITSLAGWLRLGFRSDAACATDHATELAEINADGGSGSGDFASTTDAQEAIKDAGGGGGGGGDETIEVDLNTTFIK